MLTFSCSSDDDSSGSETADPIIGKWQSGDVIYTLNDGSELTRQADACDLQTSLEFNSNNTVALISYVNNGTGGCELESDNFEYFNWSKISDGSYSLISKNQGESEESEVLSVFKCNDLE